MASTRIKSFVIVFVLLIVVGVLAVGCKPRGGGMVNTDSMPGHTFQKYRKYINYSDKADKTNIVQNTDNKNQDENFGPKDISFDFKDLK